MRLLARWLVWRAGLPIPDRDTPLPVAVQQARSILVVALAEAGDMVLLTVFLRGLRRLAPTARVTLVCLPASGVLFERSADVDHVLEYDARMPRVLRPLLLPRRARRFAEQRLVDRYELAIVPRWDTDHYLAAAVALCSGAPRRLWHAERSTRRKRTLNAGLDGLFTDLVTSDGVAHEVERHLTMLRAMGASDPTKGLAVALGDEDHRRAAEALAGHDADGALIALGIGAADPKRRWPLPGFSEVGRALQREHGARLVIVGGPSDVTAQEDLMRALGVGATGLAGRLTLRESAAVLQRCRLFIGNDSAPMHLAAAVGVPCVEISCHPAGGDPMHNNAPERFAPWGVPNVVIRPTAVAPCTSSCTARTPHCILGVSPAMVMQAVAGLLRRATPPAPGATLGGRA